MCSAYVARRVVVTTRTGGRRGDSELTVYGESGIVITNQLERDVSMGNEEPEDAPRSALLVEPLTEREQMILRFVANGLSDREIAQRLSLALDTVKWYNKRIYSKLDVHNRTQAATLA